MHILWRIKYVDTAIFKAESDFNGSIQTRWPTRRWDGHLELYAKSDTAALNFDDQNHHAIPNFSFNMWLYSPRCQQNAMERRDKEPCIIHCMCTPW